jgi:hypothetical protein
MEGEPAIEIRIQKSHVVQQAARGARYQHRNRYKRTHRPLFIITNILVLGAVSWGEVVIAPTAFAILIVMVVCAAQFYRQIRLPRMLA